MLIRKECEVLSDGSHVFNLIINDDQKDVVTLHCITEEHCDDMIVSMERNTVDVENDNIFDVLKNAL